jgi:outer membrane biosynthesis protein TonB
MSEQEKEQKNKRVAMTTSISIHAILLILFFFLLAWKEPFPPIPEYGIELALGFDDAGMGNSPNTSPVRTNNTQPAEASPGDPPTPTEVPKVEATPPTPVSNPEVKPAEQSPARATTEAVRTPTPPVTQTEASVKVEEKPVVKKVEETVEKKTEEVKTNPTTTTTPPTTQTQTTTQPPKETTINQQAVMRPRTTQEGTGGTTTGNQTAQSSNRGDQNQAGTQGREGGTIDARSLYGAQGQGGGGTSLNMAGWQWDRLPRPQDTSSESGIIVFEIRIDANGDIMGIRTLEKTVSAAVEKIYRDEVAKLTFSKTSENTRPAAISTGTITFRIQAK